MNLLPLVLGFVLLGSFKNKKQNFDLSSIFSNPELLSLLPHVAKLFDKTATDEDKNLAMMNLMTNPAIFDIMQKFASQKDDNSPPDKDEKPKDDTNDDNHQPDNQKDNKDHQQTDDNSNCKNNDKSQDKKFSDESKEFFRPVEKVAGVEISQKLYSLYDNWYIKK